MDQAPLAPLPTATYVTVVQYGHFRFLFGMSNAIYIPLVLKHLAGNLALQETFLTAFLGPLLIGDLMGIIFALWGHGRLNLGEIGMDGQSEFVKAVSSESDWSLWVLLVLEMSVLIPRLMWVLGIGRYLHRRDGPKEKIA
jgi:hypothetical protein